jgi:hypothetical protein
MKEFGFTFDSKSSGLALAIIARDLEENNRDYDELIKFFLNYQPHFNVGSPWCDNCSYTYEFKNPLDIGLDGIIPTDYDHDDWDVPPAFVSFYDKHWLPKIIKNMLVELEKLEKLEKAKTLNEVSQEWFVPPVLLDIIVDFM